MNLFIISNLFTIELAQSIIEQESLTNNIAILNSRNSSLYVNEYSKVLLENLNSNYWSDKYETPTFFQDVASNNSIFKAVFVRLQFRSHLIKLSDFYKSIIIEKKVDTIFIPDLYSLEQSILLPLIKRNEFELSICLYEQAIPADLFDLPIKKTDPKYFLRKTLDYLLFSDLFNYTVIPSVNNTKVDKYYSLFPTLSTKVQAKQRIKIIQAYNSEELNSLFSDSILFLSDPLSEDGFVDLINEFEMIKSIVDDFQGKNIYIKFHPRESSSKIKRILNEFNFFLLEDKLRNIPAEKLIFEYNFYAIVGTICSTLIIASTFTNQNVISYLDKLNSNNLRIEKYFEIFTNSFKRIIIR